MEPSPESMGDGLGPTGLTDNPAHVGITAPFKLLV